MALVTFKLYPGQASLIINNELSEEEYVTVPYDLPEDPRVPFKDINDNTVIFQYLKANQFGGWEKYEDGFQPSWTYFQERKLFTTNNNQWEDSVTVNRPSETEIQIPTKNCFIDKNISLNINVKAGSALIPNTNININPVLSIDNSTGTITANINATKNITPVVNPGFVSVGSTGTITISGNGTLNLSSQAAQTIIPSTTAQTIASGQYLTGTQTIAGDANLIPSNIKRGVSIFNVTGTLNSVTLTNNEDFYITVPNGNEDTVTFHFVVDANGNTTVS